MKPYFFKCPIYILSFLLLLSACKEDTHETKEIKHDTIVPLSLDSSKQSSGNVKSEDAEDKDLIPFSAADKKILMLPDSITFSISYKKAKEIFPNLKKPNAEGGGYTSASNGLTEASATIGLMNKKINLELNFRNDSLYSYFFTLEESNFEKAGIYYRSIRNFYNGKFGDCRQEAIEEENRYTESCYWPGREFQTFISNNINEGNISWGFQYTKP